MSEQSPEFRPCSNCNNSVQVDPLYWAYKDGKPLGLCLACHAKCKTRQRERELREPTNQPAVGTVAKKAKPAAVVKAEVKAVSRLEATNALKAGAVVLNEHAEFVMAKVLEYASNAEHKHHLWALELLAQRILPRKLYEELGGQAAGVGSLNDKRPSFTINILPATPAEGRVIDAVEYESVAYQEPGEGQNIGGTGKAQSKALARTESSGSSAPGGSGGSTLADKESR